MNSVGSGQSIDRNKAIGYLIARAMAAEVFGNEERRRAFAEAAHILKTMPSVEMDRPVVKSSDGQPALGGEKR